MASKGTPTIRSLNSTQNTSFHKKSSRKMDTVPTLSFSQKRKLFDSSSNYISVSDDDDVIPLVSTTKNLTPMEIRTILSNQKRQIDVNTQELEKIQTTTESRMIILGKEQLYLTKKMEGLVEKGNEKVQELFEK